MTEPDDIARQALECDRAATTDEIVGGRGASPPDTDGQSLQEKTLSESERQGPPINTSPPSLVAVGSKLGPYQLINKLGEGGMGAVYEAQHIKLKKTFALKVLPPRFASKPIFVEAL